MQTRERTSVPGVFKRGSIYQVIYRDRYGKQRSRTAPTLSAAKRLKAQLEADKSRGIGEPSTLTLAVYAEQWISTFRGRTKHGVAPSTIRSYRKTLRLHILPHLGSLRLGAIEPRDCKALLATLHTKLADSTVQNIVSILKIMLNEAVEDGLIIRSPAATLRVSRDSRQRIVDPTLTLPDPSRISKALSESEIQRVLAVSGEHRTLILALYHGGLRIAELLGLQFRDIDLEAGVLHVRRQYHNQTVDRWQLPKGAKTRSIPLSKPLAKALGECEGDQTARVFPYSHSAIYVLLSEIKHRAGLSWITPHTFRHTCATHLILGGANVKQVQLWLGHHDAAFTLRTYVHLLPEDLDASIFDGGSK